MSGAFALLIFFSFVAFGEAERGKYAAFSTVAIFLSVGIFWDNRKSIWFVSALLVALFLHLVSLFLINPENERLPAMVFAPFSLLDSLIVYALFLFSRKFIGSAH